MKNAIISFGTGLGVWILAGCATSPAPQAKSTHSYAPAAPDSTVARSSSFQPAQGQSVWVGVQAEHTSIKEQREPSAEQVAEVRFGDALTVIERSGSWLRVQNTNGRQGWIHRLMVCDQAALETRKMSGQIPTAIILCFGFKDSRNFTVSVLAGGMRADMTLLKGNCIAFEDEPGLAMITTVTAFKGDSIEHPEANLLYYFNGRRFERLAVK